MHLKISMNLDKGPYILHSQITGEVKLGRIHLYLRVMSVEGENRTDP